MNSIGFNQISSLLMINNETGSCFRQLHCRVLDDNKLHLLLFHFNLENPYKCVYKLFIFSRS